MKITPLLIGIESYERGLKSIMIPWKAAKKVTKYYSIQMGIIMIVKKDLDNF